MEIVFMGGIHGAGKTYICRELAPLIAARHLTAGELIAEARSRVPRKEVNDVDANQALLVAAIDGLRAAVPRLLLDGHFCVLTAGGHAMPIDVAVFRRIGPQVLLVLAVSPDDAARRLISRDSEHYPAELLAFLQHEELSHARTVGAALGVPLHILDGSAPLSTAVEFLSTAGIEAHRR